MERRTGRIGFYGEKTRALQRRLTFEAFGLTHKSAEVYMYLGSRENADPQLNDIQNPIFAEVPDRAYKQEPIEIPIGMKSPQPDKMDFSRFGIMDPMSQEEQFKVHRDDFFPLGREMVVGDVFEIPFFEKKEKGQFWEVTDVDNKIEIEQYIVVIHATPLTSSRKTNDLPVDDMGNDEALSNMMTDLDNEVESDVQTTDVGYGEPDNKESVDYRYKKQKNFIDEYQ